MATPVKKKTNSQRVQSDSIRLITIGASAGGLEALKTFFSKLPTDVNYSFVVIQHLSADFKSMMAELISKSTNLRVKDIDDKEEIEEGIIYTLPPAKNLHMKDGMLILKDRPSKTELNLPIDIFLKSYAEELKEQSIAIILTGTGSDGTRGIRSVKEAGGMVMVQDPNDAKFDGMPRSAVNTGLADYVLPIEELPTALSSYIEHNYEHEHQFAEKDPQKEDIDQIISMIASQVKLDFSEYKKPTIIRRINHRMHVNGMIQYSDYIRFLKTNTEEVDILYREFLIGVSRFFRDKEAWDILSKQVIPVLIRSRKDGETIKLWSVGCSTGEEAYSLSILVQEELRKQGKQLDVKIFATDIDKNALERAGRGIFSESIKADIPPELLKKYFVQKGDLYQVKEVIRRPIIFSFHNVTADPGFNRIDLLSCRNLLIYLNNELQQRVISVLHYALNLHGYLLLGSSESVGEIGRYLDIVHSKTKIWQKNTLVRTTNLKLKREMPTGGGKLNASLSPVLPSMLPNLKISDVLESLSTNNRSVYMLVSSDMKLIEAFGQMSKYASLPEQGFSNEVKQLFPRELALTLSTSIKKMQNEPAEPIIIKSFPVRVNSGPILLDIHVNSINKSYNQVNSLYLVTINETAKIQDDSLPISEWNDPKDVSRQRIEDLEYELRLTKDNLEHTIEELETSNEELQATNEELLASNEELQSTNEELQSVNEELYSVNSEYQYKVSELEELNADLDNLFASTNVGIIFLSNELRIRKFTPAFRDIFSLLPTDSGRNISSFKSKLPSDQHEILIHRIQEASSKSISDEFEIHNGRDLWYQVRITTSIDSTSESGNGLVVSFTDITNIKRLTEKVQLQEETYRNIFNSSMVSIWQLDLLPLFDRVRYWKHEKIEDIQQYLTEQPSEIDKLIDQVDILNVNDFTIQIFGFKSLPDFSTSLRSSDGLKSFFFDLLKQMAESLFFNSKNFIYQQIKVDDINGNTRYLNANVGWPKSPDAFQSISLTLTDVTQQVISQKELSDKQVELQKKNESLNNSLQQLEQFTHIVSHDIKNPLSNLINLLQLFEKEQLNEFNLEMFDNISSSVDKLNWVVQSLNKILASKKLESLAPETINLSDILASLEKDLSNLLEKSGAKISHNIPKSAKVWMPGVHVNSIIQNLITNAIKHAPKERKPVIDIEFIKKDGFLITDFKDNGIGIPKKAFKTIFNAFERLDKDSPGEGIGLFIVQSTLLKYGGTIEILESTVDKGSTFRVSWPIKSNNL